MLPRARKKGLVVREIGNELLVYDLQSFKASSLNRTATLVWRQCDGKTSLRQMNARIKAELGLPLGEPVVQMALARLHAAHLLEPITPKDVRSFSRREWGSQVSRLGLSATVLPAIISILAPTVAEAQSHVSSAECDARTVSGGGCLGVPCVGGAPPGSTCQQQGNANKCRCQ